MFIAVIWRVAPATRTYNQVDGPITVSPHVRSHQERYYSDDVRKRLESGDIHSKSGCCPTSYKVILTPHESLHTSWMTLRSVFYTD